MSEIKVPVVECRQLQKKFVQRGMDDVTVLEGIDFEVQAGEQIAIVGTSGSGKSTLLHLMGGLDTPSSGEVWVGGQNMARLSPAARGTLRNQEMGFVYQFHHLLPEFSALENVAMPLLIRGLSMKEAQKQAKPLLEEVGLSHRLQHKPGELSGGERQRAAIARALVTKPRCILADEPTGNLDEHTAEQVMAMFLDLNREYHTSFVVVTHNLTLAARMERIMVLSEGGLRQQ